QNDERPDKERKWDFCSKIRETIGVRFDFLGEMAYQFNRKLMCHFLYLVFKSNCTFLFAAGWGLILRRPSRQLSPHQPRRLDVGSTTIVTSIWLKLPRETEKKPRCSS